MSATSRSGGARSPGLIPPPTRADGRRAAPALDVTGLRKEFDGRTVLDGIDLHVPEGTVFSLLGPNGAGKTTTVAILSTLLAPDGGRARVAGYDLVRQSESVRSVIGVTGQFAAVDPLLTAEENLRLMADLAHLDRATGRRRTAELLDAFDLTEAARRTVGTLSGGMRRKLDLAMTLVGEPRLLFLDEPTTGLDPRSRRTVWETVRRLVDEQRVTVFLTTQYLEEADHLADRIAVLDRGRIVAEGTADDLKRRVPGGHIRLHFPDRAALRAAAALLDSGTADPEALTLRVPGDGGIPALRAVLDVLGEAAVPADRLSVHTPDLDDVFLALTDPGTHSEEHAR
ncbi:MULTISPECIES: ATP-binding cassette domain-containing protein [Streptomyces]|uniref:ATP-binding cassette domain-containing protein n=1 Tax=Streptomyces TaxID=1883 RepID=UPI00099D4A19|nr:MULTISPECIES: ATP-binding cassette domain-containing protein [Streptomyces]